MILKYKLFESSFLLKRKTIDVKSWEEVLSAIPYIDSTIGEIFEDILDNRVDVTIEKKVFVGNKMAADKGALKSELISEFVDYINWGYIIKLNITHIKNNKNPNHFSRAYINSRMNYVVNIREYFEFYNDLFNALHRLERYFEVMMSDLGNILMIQLKNEDSPVEVNRILTEPVRSQKEILFDKIEKYLSKIATIQRKDNSIEISENGEYSIEMLFNIVNNINKLKIVKPIMLDGKIVINL